MKTCMTAIALASVLLAACNKMPDSTQDPLPTVVTADSDGAGPAGAAVAASAQASEAAVVNAAIDRVLGNHAQYEAMVKAYQAAVTDGDKAAVAALVNYPLAVTLDGKQTSIPDAMAFVGHYDQIITPAIASVIKAQKYPELMVSGRGVMFGNGETWINGICRPDSADCSEFDVKVIAIQPAG
jgi:hypothetical protein